MAWGEGSSTCGSGKGGRATHNRENTRIQASFHGYEGIKASDTFFDTGQSPKGYQLTIG